MMSYLCVAVAHSKILVILPKTSETAVDHPNAEDGLSSLDRVATIAAHTLLNHRVYHMHRLAADHAFVS
jgi:hypothetical protein